MTKHLISLLLSALSFNVNASGCFDTRWGGFESEKVNEFAMSKADVIFRGKNVYTEKTISRFENEEEYVQKVESHWGDLSIMKGESRKEMKLIADTPCSCKKIFEPGLRYVIYATMNTNGVFVPFSCYFVSRESEFDKLYKN